MLIKVIYTDGSAGETTQTTLDDRIRKEMVAAFCRPRENWVKVQPVGRAE